MKERTQLVTLYETGMFTVTELAKRYRVSRKTAHKWMGRYAEEGIAGISERSRAPYRSPEATPAEVVVAVLQAKRAHPTWGPAKLLPGTEVPPEIARAWPAVSTRGRILAQHGMVKPRRRRRHVAPWTQPFLKATQPNDVWCADFKGHFRTADGVRCDPLTISDAYSRMLLCCQILTKPDGQHVRPVFERVFREYGLPLAIRTDNGPPFASIGAGGLSALSAWWIKLGIIPERIAPGHPEQNGRHERLHRTLKQETMSPPAATPAAQQTRCHEFRLEYNTVRPHEALGQEPPATLYAPSLRVYPARLGDITYGPLTEVRRVRSNGQIKWRGKLVFVNEALVGEMVGITEDKDAWLVSFGPIPLGLLHPHHPKLIPLPPKTPPLRALPARLLSLPVEGGPTPQELLPM
jgi:transposase InsO family protein